MQKRSPTAKRFPNSWGFFGGGVEDGETAEEAMKRETLEELGLKLARVEKLFEHDYHLEEYNEKGIVHIFVSEYDGSTLSLNEGSEMKWFAATDALTLDLHPIYRDILMEIVQKHPSMLS